MLIMKPSKAWLNYPDYYFYWTYDGINNSVFDDMNYVNPAMDKQIEAARFESDKAKYDDEVKGFIKIAFDDVPRIPLVQRTSATSPCRRAYRRTTPIGFISFSTSASSPRGRRCRPSAERGPPGPLMVMMRTWRSALRSCGNAEAAALAAGDGDPEHHRGDHRHLHTDAHGIEQSGVAISPGLSADPAGDLARFRPGFGLDQTLPEQFVGLLRRGACTAISAIRSAPGPTRSSTRSRPALRPRLSLALRAL